MNYSNDLIEKLLQGYRPATNVDYDKYRNHVYWVFLNCLLLDTENSNEEKYAFAAVLHDIGIWTNNTIDYIDPSIEQAKKYLIEINKAGWIEEISLIIYWHHKKNNYTGEYPGTVENFRKADWIDVSLGLLSFGCDRKKISANKIQFPNAGFHIFLMKQIIKQFFKHPLNPLPMFK